MISIQKNENQSYEDNEKKNNEAIHDTGIVLAMHRFNNKEIINFIKNDIFYISDKYRDHTKRDENVFKRFDIHNADKEEFSQLINLKICDIFNKKLEKLFRIFINKIDSFDDLTILYELFPIKIIDNNFLNLLFEKLKEVYYINEDEIKLQKLYENIFLIFEKMNQYNINLSKFTSIIENNIIDSNIKKNIYIFVLSKNDNKITNYVINEFSQYFLNNLKDLNEEGIYNLIKACSNNKNFLIELFNKIEEYSININDFYNGFKTKKWNLYELFKNNGYIEKYKDTNYCKLITKLIEDFYLDCTDLNIKYKEIYHLIENHTETFKSKLKIISDSDKLFMEVSKNLEICKEQLLNLDRIYNYIKTFEPEDNDELIDNIQKTINNLKNGTIKEIIKQDMNLIIPNYLNILDESENVKYKESIIFMKLYEELKREKKVNYTKEFFNECIEEYNLIIKKIINFKDEDYLKIQKIDVILELIKDKKDEIDKEMEFISNEFKDFFSNINDGKEESDKITIQLVKNTLVNFANLKQIKDYLNSYLFVISLFQEISQKENYQETEFTIQLKEKKEEMEEDYIEAESINKAIELLKNYDIDIFSENNDFNHFLLKCYGRKKEIEFCIGKTDEEIKNLNEFLQDRQSESGNLQPQDLDDFIGCKKFVNEVIKENFSNDHELDKILKNYFKKEKFLIIIFNNYFEKYGEIKELYDDSITNKSEITKSIIQTIMNQSTILIKKEGNNFIFNGEYGEKKKEFNLKLLIELKNKALFAQNMIKEDEIYKEQITYFNNIAEN